jgi:hypothetical protein
VTNDPASDTPQERRDIDARGAMGVQLGDGSTQVNYFYNRLTWTDGVAPPPLASVSGSVESPYRGLSAFGERDAAFFFGREKAATQVLEKMTGLLGNRGMLVVSGASGAGKSSLLRAGVLPRLRGAGLALVPEAASWPCVVVTPGSAPLDELAVRVALLTGAEAATVRRTLEADPSGFALTARQAALAARSGPEESPGGRMATQRRLLIIVDQFEQVFTQCPDESEREAFIAALHSAAAAGHGDGDASAALVVLAVRADFEARCARYPELVDAVQDRYLVTGMTERQLRMAITEPAVKAGSRVEDSLVEVLLREVRSRQAEAGAGVLPLLSHALDQAWRSRAGDGLSLADYERTGGIERAVADSAQGAYDHLTADQQAVARQVFTGLATVSDEGTDTARRVATASLLAGKTRDQARDVEAVLEAFTAERLVTLADGTVEISHEILLSAWPLLRDVWLAETHADRIARARLGRTAAEWAGNDHDKSYLYSGSLLETATETAARVDADPARHLPLDPAERNFLLECAKAARSASRRRRLATALVAVIAAVVIAALGVAGASWTQRNQAVQQRRQAQAAQASAQQALILYEKTKKQLEETYVSTRLAVDQNALVDDSPAAIRSIQEQVARIPQLKGQQAAIVLIYASSDESNTTGWLEADQMTERALSAYGFDDEAFKGTAYRYFEIFGAPQNTVTLNIYLLQS